MRQENAHLERTARELERRAQSSRERAASAERNLDQAKRRLAVISAALELQAVRLEQQRRDLAATKSELQGKIAELAAQKENLEAATTRLREVSAELAHERGELAAQQRELDRTREALGVTQSKLASASQRLGEVEAKLADVNHELDNADRVMRETARTLIDLEGQREELQAQIEELSQWRSAAREAFQVIRTQPMMFGANEEILTAVVPGERPAAKVRADLEDFVALVNRVAVAAGAGAGDDRRGIDLSRPVWDEASNRAIIYSEDQVLDALAKEISGIQGSVIVRAASLGNVVRGETVRVVFELFHNELVFRQGQELARTALDSSRDQATLLLDLVTFLRSKVSTRAREKGVMPRPAAALGPGRENLFPNPDAVVGEITYPDLLQVIREVKARKGMVAVIARAASDSWTAGPLQVKLAVESRS